MWSGQILSGSPDDGVSVNIASQCVAGREPIADTASAKAFSMAMMGTEAPDDALYEMLNIVGGRIKQAVTATGRDATLDVPNVEMLEDAPAPALSPACLVLAFGVQGQPFALTVICDADPPARDAMKAAS